MFFTCEIVGFLTGPSIAGAILAKSGYNAVIGYSCESLAREYVYRFATDELSHTSGGAMLLGSCFAVLARFQSKPME